MSYQSQSPSWEQTELHPLVAANDNGTTTTSTDERTQNFRPTVTIVKQRTSLLCSLLINGLENSTMLITKLPRVRRLALIESIHHNLLHNQSDGADKEVLDMILYNIHTSPYLSQEDFQNIVKSSLWLGPSSMIPTEIMNDVLKAVTDSNWNALCAITRNHDMTHTTTFNTTQEPPNEEERLNEFRDMVVCILQTSKRLTNMEKRRRSQLGRKIHSSKSIKEIVHVATVFLDTSKLFTDDSQRQKIKDLVASGRFDLLLQSEYFDCEEQKRIQRSDYVRNTVTPEIDEEEGLVAVQEEEYCVICFEDITTTAATTILEQCGHKFCTECIKNWLRRNSTCPTCRGQVRTSEMDFFMFDVAVNCFRFLGIIYLCYLCMRVYGWWFAIMLVLRLLYGGYQVPGPILFCLTLYSVIIILVGLVVGLNLTHEERHTFWDEEETTLLKMGAPVVIRFINVVANVVVALRVQMSGIRTSDQWLDELFGFLGFAFMCYLCVGIFGWFVGIVIILGIVRSCCLCCIPEQAVTDD